MIVRCTICLLALCIHCAATTHILQAELQVATFRADVTPPAGSPLCDGLCPPATGVNDPLSARGIILKPDNQPPVALLALDWVGVGNEGHDAWRNAIAVACGIESERVAVHCLHQHDAPGCDFLADRIAAEAGLAGQEFPVEFARVAIDRTAAAARDALSKLTAVTHIGRGIAQVEQVASNRRVLGPDGKVKKMRLTACTDAQLRAEPEGTIDPSVRLISFWHDDRPLAVLSYYATHPQSFYRTGKVSADFIGMARDKREQVEGADLHIHFNGAGGNVGAGKYNDGAPSNRQVLADRLADGMREAWEQTKRSPTNEFPFAWKTCEVALPVAPWYNRDDSVATMHNAKIAPMHRIQAAREIAWADRCVAGNRITVARLRLGDIDILHLPGELFVEYQLAAQLLKPESFICMAAYGDYGVGYIGTSIAYAQGGYETGVDSRASRTSPAAESILMSAIEELLK